MSGQVTHVGHAGGGLLALPALAGLEAHYVLPVGSRVVEQSPAPGEKAKRGSGVRLLLNLF